MSEQDQLIAAWQRAFEAANNEVAPQVTYRRGWFVVHHGGNTPIKSRLRKSTFLEATERLRLRVPSPSAS